MSKRVYHLTIEYDTETDDVSYIVETVEEEHGDMVKLTTIGNIDLEDHFEEEDIKAILEAYEIGEA